MLYIQLKAHIPFNMWNHINTFFVCYIIQRTGCTDQTLNKYIQVSNQTECVKLKASLARSYKY